MVASRGAEGVWTIGRPNAQVSTGGLKKTSSDADKDWCNGTHCRHLDLSKETDQKFFPGKQQTIDKPGYIKEKSYAPIELKPREKLHPLPNHACIKRPSLQQNPTNPAPKRKAADTTICNPRKEC